MTRARDLANLGDNTSKLEQTGLIQVIPTSVSSGSSVDSKGNVTFSAQSTVSLNGIFTSSYDNYLINWIFLMSANASSSWRLRNAGSDLSTSTYNYDTTGGAASTSQTSWYLTDNIAANSIHTGSFNIFRPFLSETKFFIGNKYATDDIYLGVGGRNTTASSYDGFTFIPGSGTITGTIRVYGYNQ